MRSLEPLSPVIRPEDNSFSLLSGSSHIVGGELLILQLVASIFEEDLGQDDKQRWLIHQVCEILGAEAGILMLFEQEGGQLLVKKLSMANMEWEHQVRPKPEGGIAFESIQERRPIRIEDATADPRIKTGLESAGDCPVRSLVCAPLLSGDRAFGAIEILNKRDASFTLSDLELLAVLSGMIASAIADISLIQELKVANANLEANRWELINSRNTLRALFDCAPISIYIVDPEYKLVAINMTRANKAGKTPQDMVGEKCFATLYGRKEPCPGCLLSETLSTGKNTTRIEQRWESDLEPLELEITTHPIWDDSGEVVQAFLFEEDVTEKHRLEASLAQSEKLAAVGQLAAGVAHEINNPLTVIIANAQLLRRMIPPDEDLREMVDLISRAGDRAAEVIHNLLDFARKEQYQLNPINVNDTLQSVLPLIQHELVTRSIRLIFKPANNLSPVLASRDNLQGVWLNLIMNAIDAIGEQEGEIRITTGQNQKDVMVRFVDTGVGIPPDRIPRLFEPFFTTKEPGRGTGLGLSICHQVIKQHGGQILVDSQQGVGTTFTVLLPIS
jgi:two-component system NtrC family sensor kinase